MRGIWERRRARLERQARRAYREAVATGHMDVRDGDGLPVGPESPMALWIGCELLLLRDRFKIHMLEKYGLRWKRVVPTPGDLRVVLGDLADGDIAVVSSGFLRR